MVETWYTTTGSGLTIEPVEIERATELSVWLKGGKRQARQSGWRCYFPTFREAYEYLERLFEKEAEAARVRLASAERKSARLKELYGAVLAASDSGERSESTT